MMASLSEERVRELWKRYKMDGDLAARERLILAYAPLVKYVAGRMSSGLPAHIDEADLISYGLLGLIGAVERFDPGRDIKFETYAVSRIKGSIIDELRSLDWVPRSVRSKAREIERACARLENDLQRAPTDEEICEELDMTGDEFHYTLTQISNTSIVALDELWEISGSDGDTASLIETLEDPKSRDPSKMLDLTEMKAQLAKGIDALPDREKIVIALYYYENLTLREIGEVLGVTESRVSQLHTKAILRLKGRLRDDMSPGWQA
jgi:RNA polymerase sigma factor for flagellar operon FliA